MFLVLPHTRASCAAWRFAEELCGGTGDLVRGVRAAAVVIFTAVAVAACGSAEVAVDAGSAEQVADISLRFEGAAPSLDFLGEGVLQAMARQDETMLEAYRLTEYEHNEVVWPELPASAPEVNFPLDYAWENIQNRNTRAVARLVPHFADRAPSFQRAECRGEPQAFRTFHVDTDCWIVFSRGTSPELWEIQAFKDVIVRGGGMKVFRYYDEEPRPHRRDGIGT